MDREWLHEQVARLEAQGRKIEAAQQQTAGALSAFRAMLERLNERAAVGGAGGEGLAQEG